MSYFQEYDENSKRIVVAREQLTRHGYLYNLEMDAGLSQKLYSIKYQEC